MAGDEPRNKDDVGEKTLPPISDETGKLAADSSIVSRRMTHQQGDSLESPGEQDLRIDSVNTDELDTAGDYQNPPGDAFDDNDAIEQLINRIRQEQPDALADMIPHEEDQINQFGRFEIRRQLGQGGFGIVYLAYDPELSREIALKVPRIESLVTPQVRDRFLREAQAVARLQHRNIATIFESGSQGPVCYIASAYYSGGSLAELLATSPNISHRQAAQITLAISEGMQHAHSRGILHRDLKPANILLATESATGILQEENIPSDEVLITDFGLAKFVDEFDSNTKTGTLIGSPAYMAPELADSRQSDVGTATDVYSIGALLYELLTGQPPHRAETVLATLQLVQNQEPLRPSAVKKDVPRDLEAICLKCLEKEPKDRYQTAYELHTDLDNWLEGRPVIARTATTTERFARWCRRNPAWALLLSTISAAIISIAVIATTAYFNVSAARQSESLAAEARAEQQLRREANFQRARSAVDALLKEIGVTTLVDEPRMGGVRRAILQKALTFYAAFLDDRADDDDLKWELASTHQSMGQIERMLGNLDAAEDHLIQSISMLEALAETDDHSQKADAALVNSLMELSNVVLKQTEQERIQKATELLKRSLAIIEQQETVNPSDTAHCLIRLGRIAWSQRKDEEARDHYDRALLLLNSLETKGTRSKTLETGALQGLAHLEGDAEPDSAERRLRQAVGNIEQLIEQFPDRVQYHASLSALYSELSQLLGDSNRLQECRDYAQRTVTILERLESDFPNNSEFKRRLGESIMNIGRYRVLIKDYEEAERSFDRAVTVFAELRERFPQRIEFAHLEVVTKFKQADMNYRLRNSEKARALASRAVEQLHAAPSTDSSDPDVKLMAARAYRRSGGLAQLLNKPAESIKEFERALEILETADSHKNDPPFLRLAAELHIGISSAAQLQRNGRKTKEHLDTALRITKRLAQRFPNNETIQTSLGIAYMNCGGPLSAERRYDEAKQFYDQAAAVMKTWDLTSGARLHKIRAVAELHYHMGTMLNYQRRFDDAIKEFETALEVRQPLDDLKRPWPHLEYQRAVILGNLATCQSSMSRFDEAIRLHKLELEILSRLSKSYSHDRNYSLSFGITSRNLAFQLSTHPDPKKQDAKLAVKLCEDVIKRGRPNPRVWRILGMAQYRAGDDAKAIFALTRDPRAGRDPLACYFLAMASHKKGELEQAKAWRDKALQATRSLPGELLERIKEEAEQILQSEPSED